MNALLRFAGLITLVLASGCDDKPLTLADAGGVVDSGPVKPDLGGKLGAAVAAAESANARPKGAPGGSKDGPPENGIFQPGGADAAVTASAPPKIEVINEGSEPRVALAFTPAGDEQRAAITVGVRLAQGGLPAIDFGLSFKIDRPKDPKDKKDQAESSGPLPILAKVTSVEPGKEVAGRFPKDIADALAKFKGTEIRYVQSPNGVMSKPQLTLSKDADPKVDIAVRALVEALTLLSVPLPSKPIGAGGYWMVTDRSSSFNMDVVRYRVFRVQTIDKDKASLAVDIRQYSANEEVDLGALANNAKIKLDRFDSQGKGTVAWSSSALLPPGDQVNVRVMIAPAGQRGGIPLEIDGQTIEPPKDKGDKKK